MNSVLEQTHSEIEYLLIDGGSTDGTVEVIREYEPRFSGRMRWVSKADDGLYDAINKGIGMATGEVIGILNSDDFFASADILAQVIQGFSDSAVDCVFGDIRFVREPDLVKTVRYYCAKHFRPWMLRFGFMPPHPTFFARRGLFGRFGNYKTDYRIAADYELLVRFLWVERVSYLYLDLAMTRMRLGGMSTRSPMSTYILNREIVRACRENRMWTILPMLGIKYFFKVFELLNTRDH